MSETEKAPDAPRPERILPTEPGWWWCQPYFGCQPEIREVWLSSREGRGLVFYREVDGTSDESEQVGHDDGVTWLCRVPAPEQLAEKDAYIAELEEIVERLDEADEQLASQAAKVAAGQTLADIMRRGAELVALNAPDADFVPVQNETVRRSQALLRAYPPAEGGAR